MGEGTQWSQRTAQYLVTWLFSLLRLLFVEASAYLYITLALGIALIGFKLPFSLPYSPCYFPSSSLSLYILFFPLGYFFLMYVLSSWFYITKNNFGHKGGKMGNSGTIIHIRQQVAFSILYYSQVHSSRLAVCHLWRTSESNISFA